MKTTYAKHGIKKRRFAAMFLAAIMCFGAINANFYANEQSLNMSASAAENNEIQADQTYYDSGTMWLQAYYSDGTGAIDNNDPVSVKTNGLYKTSTMYHETDGWLTLDVESSLDEDVYVTLPETTDINDPSKCNVMSCWREYLGSLSEAKGDAEGDAYSIYGVNVTDFGTPAATGQVFSYIAEGTTAEEDIDNDGIDEIRIDWQIRAWPGETIMTDYNAIKAEWEAIETDISNDKLNGNSTYVSDFYSVYAPKWESGNNWYDDWIISDKVSIEYTDWDSENGASYNNTCVRNIKLAPGAKDSDLWSAMENGDSLKYVYDNRPWLRFDINNRYAALNQNYASDTDTFVEYSNVTGSYMNVHMPVMTVDSTKYAITDAAIASDAVYNGTMEWTFAADGLNKGTSSLSSKDIYLGIPYGPGHENIRANYAPNIASVISSLSADTFTNIITPAYTDMGGKEPTAYRLYGYSVKAWDINNNEYSYVLDNHSLDDYAYLLAYAKADANTPTVLKDAGTSTKANLAFAELAKSATTTLNVGLLYDVTYDQQRAGGDITGYVEPVSSCDITTELTNVVTGNHFAEATTDVDLNEKVTYTFTGSAYLNKNYVAKVELYVIGTNGSVEATPIAIAESDVTTITATTGSIDVELNDIDASALDGKTVVAYAELHRVDSNGQSVEMVAEHKDATDTLEQVTFTTTYVDTNLVSKETNAHVAPNKNSTVVTDTITVQGLVPGGKYYMNGYLATADMSASEGYSIVPITNAGSINNVVKTEVLTADASGKIEIVIDYTFNASDYANSYVVACVDVMSESDTLVIKHLDLKDENQTVYVPAIETDALNITTNSQQIALNHSNSVRDTIKFSNLLPANKYTIKGYIYDGNKNIASKTITFTPSDIKGTTDVVFDDFYATYDLEGETLVIHEEIYLNDVLIASHKDNRDTRQMLYCPSISTSATDGTTGTQIGQISNNTVIKDRVDYARLIPGKKYNISGALMTKDANGKVIAVTDANGVPVTASAEFTPTSHKGETIVTFTYDATVNNYTTVVVYETLNIGDTPIATHADINDDSQTVTYDSHIEIDTVALDKTSNTHSAKAAASTIISDEVVVTGLTKNRTYKMQGKLVDTKGNVIKDAKGKDVVASTEFTSTGTTFTHTFNYDYDFSNMQGKTVIATVTIAYEGTEVAIHANLKDADQTIYFPAIDTIATSGQDTTSKVINPIDSATIIDNVSLTGLIPGQKYKLVGKLYNKTDKAFVTVNGKDASETITVTVKSDGTASASMTFDGIAFSAYKNDDIVVYQYLYFGDNLVAEATDINDADETIHVNNVPSIETVLAETATGNKVIAVKESAKLTDTVIYADLTIGTNYVSVSKLIDKATGNVIKEGDKELVNEVAFTATGKAHTATIDFTFNGSTMEGKSIVAYNYLYVVINGERILIASEEDINETKQTVVFPSIDTTASDAKTGDKTVVSDKKAVINDRVDYTGLEAGKTYTLTLTVMDKATGKALEGVASVIKTFTPDASNGYTIVSVEVDSTSLKGKTLVMFETLSEGDRELCIHADLNDADQTVYVPSIDTVLTSVDGAKTVNMGDVVRVTDTITYAGLTPGVTYVINGQIIDKETREELVVNGSNAESPAATGSDVLATVSYEFTPTTADGTVSVNFEVNTSNLNGHHLVAFQKVTEKESGSLIMEHQDLNDADQTILVKTTTTVDTGVENFTNVFATMSVILLCGFAVCTVFIMRRRRRDVQ